MCQTHTNFVLKNLVDDLKEQHDFYFEILSFQNLDCSWIMFSIEKVVDEILLFASAFFKMTYYLFAHQR